jgi:hypothetical protein
MSYPDLINSQTIPATTGLLKYKTETVKITAAIISTPTSNQLNQLFYPNYQQSKKIPEPVIVFPTGQDTTIPLEV